MNEILPEKKVHRVFVISLILKGLNAVLEIIGGFLFLMTGAVSSIIIFLTQGELREDPTDFLANYIQHAIPYLSTHGQLFVAAYFLSHGVVKIFLVTCLLRNKVWAYSTSILFLGIFIAYQLYRFTFTHSIFLLFLTAFDLLLILLTWHEYKVVKKHLEIKN